MGEDYRSKGLRLFGDRCLQCGSADEVKVHHMDGDHSNSRRDNLVPLCQECHVQLHKGAPPYTIWLSLGQPVIRALDEVREERGHRSRSETVARLLLEAEEGALSMDTWSLLAAYNDSMYRGDDR